MPRERPKKQQQQQQKTKDKKKKRIWPCYELWCRWQMWLGSCVPVAVVQASSYSSYLTPSLGTSICHGCGPKNKKIIKMNESRNLKIRVYIYIYYFLNSVGFKVLPGPNLGNVCFQIKAFAPELSYRFLGNRTAILFIFHTYTLTVTTQDVFDICL